MIKIEKFIKTVSDLLEATKELNGEFQEGWDNEIEAGEDLLEFLKQDLIPSILDFAEWLDIYGIRADRHEWTWKGDNYTKRWTTREMFEKWQEEINVSEDSSL